MKCKSIGSIQVRRWSTFPSPKDVRFPYVLDGYQTRLDASFILPMTSLNAIRHVLMMAKLVEPAKLVATSRTKRQHVAT